MQQFSMPQPAAIEFEELEPLSFEPQIAGLGVEAEAIESFTLDIESLPCAQQAECPAQIDVWEHAVTSLGRENSIECLSALDAVEPEIYGDDAALI